MSESIVLPVGCCCKLTFCADLTHIFDPTEGILKNYFSEHLATFEGKGVEEAGIKRMSVGIDEYV